MKNLEFVLSDFLKQLGRIEDIKLGDKKSEPYQPSEADTKRLTEKLNDQSVFNRRILVIYLISICILYAIGIFMVFYFLDSPNKMGVVFGGSFLGLIVVNDRLYRTWREKTLIDVVLTLVKGLPPAEGVKAIESIYWARIRRTGK